MSIILGIHIGHDASVAVVREGRPVFCLAEERLTREKMHYGFPFRALECALNSLTLSPDIFDAVALDTLELPRLLGPQEMARRFRQGCGRRVAKNVRKAKSVLGYLFRRPLVEACVDRERQAREILTAGLHFAGLPTDRLQVYDHHACHAASAFFPSPFREALVVTSDGRGDGLSATLSTGVGWRLERKLGVGDHDSVGQFYAAVTSFLGFRPNRHEGKITGLAAHGDSQRLGPQFLKHLVWNGDGTYRFRLPPPYRANSADELNDFLCGADLSWKDRVVLHNRGDWSSLLYTAGGFGWLAYLDAVARDARPEDVAAGAQFVAEEITAEFIRRNLPATSTSVALAGGLFANVRVNQKIRELAGVSDVYVQPAMGDDGLALGAALLSSIGALDPHLEPGPLSRDSSIGHTFLGPAYSASDLARACQTMGVVTRRVRNRERLIAEWVHQGLIVGLFDGCLEYGPRALGHRSILARATDASINHELNRRLGRTEFMPFAPSLLAEYAADYLEDYRPSDAVAEYMTSTYNVKASKRRLVPAVVHVDGTARPQVVHRERNPRFHRILEEYERLSGIPLVINTSFNLHEEPIVCTPEDAIRAYKKGAVDILVLEDLVMGDPVLRSQSQQDRRVAAAAAGR